MSVPETMLQIANRIGKERRVSMKEIMGEERTHRVAHTRHAIWAACRATGRHTFPKIGRTFHRDHSTIMKGIDAHYRRNPEAGL